MRCLMSRMFRTIVTEGSVVAETLAKVGTKVERENVTEADVLVA